MGHSVEEIYTKGAPKGASSSKCTCGQPFGSHLDDCYEVIKTKGGPVVGDHGLKDTGERESFHTGMVREPNLGRGRYDLISPIALRRLAHLYKDGCLPPMGEETLLSCAITALERFQEGDRGTDHLAYCSLYCFEIQAGGEVRYHSKELYLGIPTSALLKLAQHYENGAAKYEDRNWEKGGWLNRYLNSAKRHLQNYLAGDRLEDHLSAVVWNCFCIMHTMAVIERGLLSDELNNLPDYMPRR